MPPSNSSIQGTHNAAGSSKKINRNLTPSGESSKNVSRTHLRTCDACKFRHQRCNASRPTCGSCKTRKLQCRYTTTPTAMVKRSDVLHEDPATLIENAEDGVESSSHQIERPRPSLDYGDGVAPSYSESLPGSSQDSAQMAVNTPRVDSPWSPSLPYIHQCLPKHSLQVSASSRTGDALQESLVNSTYAAVNNFHQLNVLLEMQEKGFPRVNLGVAGSDMIRHVQAINPFVHYDRASILPLLHSFLCRVNSVFGLFSDGELERYMDLELDSTSGLPNQVMSELCLVLALGAQASDGGNDDKIIMWYENGRRYLDDENWRDELWVMRMMALVSVYHMAERRDTSRHYLTIAVSIGRTNLLNRVISMGHMEEGERTKWLRVWDTVRFLDDWLAISLCSNSVGKGDLDRDSALSEGQPSLSPSDVKPFQRISSSNLLRNLRFIIEDIYQADAVPLKRYELHMTKLQLYLTDYPEELQNPTVDRLLDLDDQQRVILLHLHAMRLGSIVILTRPLLIQTISTYLKQTPQHITFEFGVEEFAHVCVESASNLSKLCFAAFQSGSFSERCWLPIYFLFDAALISILGIIWQRQRRKARPIKSADLHLQQANAAVEASLEVLKHCSTTNKTAHQYWTILLHLKQSIEDSSSPF